jgi:hypothetical protein
MRGLPLASAFVLAAVACGRAPAEIGFVLRSTDGLLDSATSVQLTVFDASLAKCDASSGHVNAIPSGTGVQGFALDHTGCADGAPWCKTIVLDQDGISKMFAIVAKNASGTLAEGCKVVAIDQDPLAVDIKVQRFNPPPCCNDGQLERGEQCEGAQSALTCDGTPGGKCMGITADEVCDCNCTSKEVLLSVDDGVHPPKLTNGPPGSKSSLALSFAPGNAMNPNPLRAVFVNTSPQTIGGSDISVRFMSQDLHTLSTPTPLALQLQLPLTCSAVVGGGMLRKQTSPSIAIATADTVAIGYSSDEVTGGRSEVYLTAQTLDGCTDVHPCANDTECSTGSCDKQAGVCAAAIQLSKTATSGAGAIDARIAAGPSGAVLAVWVRDGQVLGRIWHSDGSLLPTQKEVLIGMAGTHPRVAGFSGGWRVVFEGAGGGDADGVVLVNVDPQGNAGAPTRVNAVTDGPQLSPDVALSLDGRGVVTWQSGGDILLQRIDPTGALGSMDDQATPLNTITDGTQEKPAVASGGAAGDFFVVAWDTVEKGNISARIVNADKGFGFNSVTGQNDEFEASQTYVSGHRTSPAVAIGGGGYIVIGWQDDSMASPGIWARRFPLPN